MKKLFFTMLALGASQVYELGAMYHPEYVDGQYTDDAERDEKRARRHRHRVENETCSDINSSACRQCHVCTDCPGGVMW